MSRARVPLKWWLPCLSLCFLTAATARAQTPTYLSQWSLQSSPRLVAVDATGNVYVTSYRTPAIRKFSSAGAFLGQWGTSGTGPGQFCYPMGICVDHAGRVLVVDMAITSVVPGSQDRVQVFTSDGVFITQWGSTGHGAGAFLEPDGIAVDAADNVYVADVGNHRIEVFDKAGVYLRHWGNSGTGPGQFYDVESVAVDAQGLVYASDFHRIQVFSSTGSFLRQWGSNGSGPGQFDQIFGIATDPNNRIYVADRYNGRVQIFQPDGTFVSQFGAVGSDPGQFEFPWGIAIDPRLGRIYIGDPYLDRITLFGDAPTPVQYLSWGGVKARYR